MLVKLRKFHEKGKTTDWFFGILIEKVQGKERKTGWNYKFERLIKRFKVSHKKKKKTKVICVFIYG